MNKTAQSPAEKERYAADRAAHRLAKMYQKAGYHVHDESEADERESVMSHMLRDPHWRDLGTHQKCYGVPDDSHDPATSVAAPSSNGDTPTQSTHSQHTHTR